MPQHEEDYEVAVTFCDDSTQIDVYEHSPVGAIDALYGFYEYCKSGNENLTVFGSLKPVHVIKVQFKGHGSPHLSHIRVEHDVQCFDCSHTKAAANA